MPFDSIKDKIFRDIIRIETPSKGSHASLLDNRLDALLSKGIGGFVPSTLLLIFVNEASGVSLFCSETSCKLTANAAAATAAAWSMSLES